MNDKLAICPFCKNDTASISPSSHIYDDTTFVECLTCGARGPDFGNFNPEKDKQDAIEAWNSWSKQS